MCVQIPRYCNWQVGIKIFGRTSVLLNHISYVHIYSQSTSLNCTHKDFCVFSEFSICSGPCTRHATVKIVDNLVAKISKQCCALPIILYI